jgi:hypothetical protein
LMYIEFFLTGLETGLWFVALWVWSMQVT